jgi:hypothetical protein
MSGLLPVRDSELHGVRMSLSIVRIVVSSGLDMSRLEEKRNACRIVVRNPLGKCTPERPRKGSEDNNNVGLKVIGFRCRMLLSLDQGRVSWPALRLADVELLNATTISFTAF